MLGHEFVSIALGVAGTLMLAAAAGDIALTVLHPEREGPLTRRFTRWYWLALSRSIWKTPRVSVQQKRAALALLGPIVTCLLIGSWLGLLVASYAVLYLPHIGLRDARCPGCVQFGDALDAVYYSAGTLARVNTGIQITGAGVRWIIWSEALIGLLFVSSCLTFLFGLLATVDRLRPTVATMTLRAAFAVMKTVRQSRRERKKHTGLEQPDFFVQTHEIRYALQRYPLAIYYAPVNSEIVWYLINLMLVMIDWNLRDIRRLSADEFTTTPQAVYWNHLLEEESHLTYMLAEKMLTRRKRRKYREVLNLLRICTRESVDQELAHRSSEEPEPLKRILFMIHWIAEQLYVDFSRMPYEIPVLQAADRDASEIGENEFKCAQCGQRFVKAWSDEDAAAEAERLWPHEDKAQLEVLCDSCFRKRPFSK